MEDEATKAAREYARKQSEAAADADSLADLKRKYDALMKDSLRMQEYIKQSIAKVEKVETMDKAEKPGQVEVKKVRVKCIACSSEFVVQNKSVNNPICMECGCSEVERVGRPWTEYVDVPEKSSGDLRVMSAAEYAAMQSGQVEQIKDYQFPGIDKDYQEAEKEASVDTELKDALELVLMFFDGRSWDEDKVGRWCQVTGTPQATTRVLCDHIRQVLRKAK